MSLNFKKILALILLSLYSYANSQDKAVDSLNKSFSLAQTDIQKANTLQELCKHFMFSEYNKALVFGKQALALSEQSNYDKGCAKALHNIGFVYYNLGIFDSALHYFNSSLKIKQSIGDKKGMASSYNNMGAIFDYRGDYNKAILHYINSLKINEELKNYEGALSAANNIGNVLSQQHNANGAIKYYRISLAYSKKAKNNKGIADALLNIGSANFDSNRNDSALIYFNQAKQFYLKEGDQEREATLYTSIGLWHKKMHQLDTAFNYFHKAEEIYASMENTQGLSQVYDHLGKIYLEKNNFNLAEKYFTEGLKFAKSLEAKDLQASYYESLAALFSKKGDYNKAYKYHVLFYEIKDSLITKESLEQIADMNVKYETQKKEQEINILNKDNEVQTNNIKKQKIIIVISVLGLIVTILLSFLLLNTLKTTRKQKTIIENQKRLVEEKNSIVEEKNRNIIDSINYAKRIQLALLKEEEYVSEHLPEHFILFKPKDIVSGDFYWSFEKEEYWYFAVADCTGHGVPGAFMSMLGIAFLNEISASTDLLTPATILDLLRDKLVKEMGQRGTDGEAKDGMDISLVCLNMKTKQLQWAGANNPLYILRGEALKEIKGNKQSIGFHENMKPFTNFNITLENEDTFFLFTDGYADQFGGPKGKKFKYSKFKELLTSIAQEPMEKQKFLLNNHFESWKSFHEQTDDVCVIGVRV
jgi:tetratricopeptide (TPR) repeat protein